MSRWAKVLLLLGLCWLAFPLRSSAAGTEAQTFTAAEKVYLDADYKNAELYLADFLQKFPNSPRVPEAVLYQAEARLKLGNYAGALSLLEARRAQAGTLADWYLLCHGQALLAQGDFARAGADFEQLLHDFPSSPHRLTAEVNAAVAQMRLSQWSKAIQLLGRTNGLFLMTAATNHASPDVIRGFLLLSEAQLAQTDYHAAEASLQALAASPLDPTNNWQRQFLLCRVLQAEGRNEEAVQNTTNLLVLAQATGLRSVEAQTVAFQAGMLEQLDRKKEAFIAYKKNLSAGVPSDRQRQALLKSTELALALGDPAEAAEVLQAFLTQFPTNDCSDLALLTLGELRLRQYDPSAVNNRVMLVSTNIPGSTNLLEQAATNLLTFRARFPQSPLRGKAQLYLGWCYWLAGKYPESRTNFESAVALLPHSADQAQAYFKLGDSQLQLNNYTSAIPHYWAVADRFPDVQEVQTNLAEPALYQILRASQSAGDDDTETNALRQIMARYPNGSYTERAVLLAAQHLGQKFPSRARELFCSVRQAATNSPLLPQIQLAIARTYEEEGQWDQAIQQYDEWLLNFTGHVAQARAEYFRARANDEAGHQTNAFQQFTNLIGRFPTSEYAPLAQWWVADYYYGQDKPQEAESNYRLVFQNWPSSSLAYPARMMAGRVAGTARQDWDQAAEYFLFLQNDTNCPVNLRATALYAYGDTFLSRNNTNKAPDYVEAFKVFDLVCATYPTNRMAALAWGQKAICILQSFRSSDDYVRATEAFQRVINSPLADATARSMAEVGLGVIVEKIAATKPEPEKSKLLDEARGHYQRVFVYDGFLRPGEKPNPFWTRKAGMEEARLAEALHMREHAVRVYQRLQEMFPPERLDDKIKALQAQEH
jgi:TolA-binding protein